ncbi:SDR family oxidoreductase [Rhizobium sp. YJ-22]|uniref:SDR family oxidoreductase n=1 Tax=Rhizobium sp. YJ-22 TaxID=3037556 RepID=UPI00241299C4|nr:SDR family oxidoreductase [Rhizobium sp. YJ-22]MDG3575830.1 SDR family oxidoreductase [Rhizobium sp. YJ-22]
MSHTILVTGAAGHLGRAVVGHLLDTQKVDAAHIVAASRDPAKLADLAARGVAIRKGDFDDAASLESAFAGIDRLLIVSTDALAVPGQRLTQHKTAIAAAVKAGVKHLFYTSMPKPDDSLVSFAPDHLGTEEAVKASGLAYTILRDAWYHDNLLHSLPHNLSTGTWYSASGDGRIATIARDDCARAIAAALASPTTPGDATYTLTGPAAITTDEIAAIAAEVAGKPLKVVRVSDEQLAAGLKGAGIPDFFATVLVSADANTRTGRFDIVTDDFEKLTGDKPQSLKDFLSVHKAALTA